VAVSDGVVTAARICLNAVYVVPYGVQWAEEVLVGRPLDAAQAAAEAAVSRARPRQRNQYMVTIARELVKKTVLACQ
jgi:CO/xanthine dehydrogenase FAD-binding subunit